jgi:hypothetical protein
MTRSAEYRNHGMIIPKELGKVVSAVTVQQLAPQRSDIHAAANMEIRW